ncbi:MAG: hypothetical protein II208_00200 [Alphaproteobacteria bacterium]|nr:hypothetical protein [Alphaproteobacteria bacterium]
MHRFTISVLSVFVVLPAVAGTRLPVVNIASGGVSARAAFGEGADVPVKNVSVAQKKQAAPTRTKRVVARTATPAKPVDSGAQIVAASDVLTPRRPSNDLWAKNDSTLRMPMPNEFSVIRTDSILPEESLDQKIATAQTDVSVPVAKTNVAPRPVRAAVVKKEQSELDAQIARLTELERASDDSVHTVSRHVISSPVSDIKTVPESVRVASVAPAKSQETVSLRRLVVPMDTPDVVTRAVEKTKSPRIAAVREDMSSMNPNELRRAFRKTFLADNQHLSTYSIDSRFDTVSDMSASIEGFTAAHDLSEGTGIRPLEIKIKFRNADSALSRENYRLLTEYAGIVVNKPTRAIQVAIPKYMTQKSDERKLAARRLAIVEQALTDNGVSKQRIVPVLSNRDESSFVLRIISGDEYETLTKQSRNMFGETVGKKTYKSMSW